jgi:hypothetical protein
MLRDESLAMFEDVPVTSNHTDSGFCSSVISAVTST